MAKTIEKAMLKARLPAPAGAIRIEDDSGFLRGVAVMTIGPATGHGFEIDQTTLEQCLACIARTEGGVKVRWSHPENGQSGLDRLVGRIINPRIDGATLRADLWLGQYASAVPGLGDLRKYILSIARSDPAAIGLSAVIGYEFDETYLPQRRIARVGSVEAIDLVENPAANRRGLLSVPQTEKEKTMKYDQKFKSVLVSEYGLNESADDTVAEAFFDALNDAEKQAVSDKAAETPDDVAKMEAHRVQQLRALATIVPGILPETVEKAIADGLDPDSARKAYLAQLSRTCTPLNIRVGDDGPRRASLEKAMVDAVLVKYGIVSNPNEGQKRYASLSLPQLGETYLRAHQIDTNGLSRNALVNAIFNPRKAGGRVAQLAQSSSDFPGILSGSINATLRRGYDENPATWTQWAKRGTVADFRDAERPILSEIKTPARIAEGGGYESAPLLDSKETFRLAKFGRLLKLTWVTVVNDNLGAFLDIVRKMGAAARRLEDDLAYSILLANANLSDTVALFHSTHANLMTGSGNVGTPTVDLLSKARAKMAVQTGPNGAILGVRPYALIVPVELQTVSEQLVASLVDPSKNNDTSNPEFVRNMIVVGEPRLDVGVTITGPGGTVETYAGSTARWYLAASPNSIDTIEIAFLEDEPAPVIQEEQDFDTDDVKYKVRHCVGAKALDHRGLLRNGA